MGKSAQAAPTKGTPEELEALAAAKVKVAELKKSGADKDTVQAAVQELLRLKEICGEAAPSKDKKAKGGAAEQAPKKDGPSKNELKRQAKLEASGKAGKEKGKPSEPKAASSGTATALPKRDEVRR